MCCDFGNSFVPRPERVFFNFGIDSEKFRDILTKTTRSIL